MYQRRKQQVRRSMHERLVHEAQRRQQASAERERMRSMVHSAVR